MALTQLLTRAEEGIAAPAVSVEVHISNGLPSFSIVGLPEAAVRESRDRVRSAIINSGFQFPARKITVNLAPADLPKEGGRYDLAIALGILASSKQIDPSSLGNQELYGELALSGELRAVSGLVPALLQCRKHGHRALLAAANGADAALLSGLEAHVADNLIQVCNMLNGGDSLATPEASQAPAEHYPLDLAEVIGQHQGKRALEIAAAGGHHLLMMGPPGTGKSMLAQRLNTLLPEMSEEEALQTLSVYSLNESREGKRDSWRSRPFRAPHHTVSGVALVGGGSNPRPGEISLAHNGVLFLDELTEFERRTLEVLREPLETGLVHISRAARQVTYPAAFQLVAAMNPCPGGCESVEACSCRPEQLGRYQNRLSAPLLDRIDIQIELPRLKHDELLNSQIAQQETSKDVRTRVQQAHQRQYQRQGCLNARLSNRQLEQVCRLEPAAGTLMKQALERLGLSARSYHRLLKLARSIADLKQIEVISPECISEAIHYRRSPLRQQAAG